MSGERRTWGVRGATTATANTPDAILEATREMLQLLLEENALSPAEIVSALFTVTPELQADFPARAARALGWTEVPLLCATEIPVPGALPLCVRVLLHVEPRAPRSGVRHVYLRGARALRPELGYD